MAAVAVEEKEKERERKVRTASAVQEKKKRVKQEQDWIRENNKLRKRFVVHGQHSPVLCRPKVNWLQIRSRREAAAVHLP